MTREQKLEAALRSILYPKPGISVTVEQVEEMKRLLETPPEDVADQTIMQASDQFRDAVLKAHACLQERLHRRFTSLGVKIP